MTEVTEPKKRAQKHPRPIPPSVNQPRLLKAVDMPLDQVEDLASLGLSMEQIGYFFGLHPWSVELYKRQRPELNEAIERGRAKGMEHAALALRRQINSGNITAIIFYLKSRGKWREINSMEVTGRDGAPIAFESKTDKMDLSKLQESDLLAVLATLNKAVTPFATTATVPPRTYNVEVPAEEPDEETTDDADD